MLCWWSARRSARRLNSNWMQLVSDCDGKAILTEVVYACARKRRPRPVTDLDSQVILVGLKVVEGCCEVRNLVQVEELTHAAALSFTTTQKVTIHAPQKD